MSRPTPPRPKAIITGAAGGMGRACARMLGATMDLVLTDVSPTLQTFASELRSDGYTVAATIVGDQGDAAVLRALAEEAGRGFAALVHTGGLPPSADWRRIVEVNYTASVKLLDAIEPVLPHGAAAVLIASSAGHLAPTIPELDMVLSRPLDPELIPRLEAAIQQHCPTEPEVLGTLAYMLSKQQVMKLCQQRAVAWGPRGARVISLSPGMIYTPMGRHEAQVTPKCGELVTGSPLGRWGTPAEIASAVAFLISSAAGFITGVDLTVDGGAAAMAMVHRTPGTG